MRGRRMAALARTSKIRAQRDDDAMR